MLWYALHVRANTERIVAQQMTSAGLDAFYPHVVQLSKDKRREIDKKFMPGYVFGEFDLVDKTPVVAIAQVVGILGWGSHPVAIPTFEIEAVRKIVSFPELAKPSDFVSAGTRVRVRSGPLQDLEGYVVYVKNAARVVVSVTMLGRSVAADVDASALELLDPAELKAA